MKLLVFIISILIFPIAYADNDCIANQFSLKQRPSLQGIRNTTDFVNWKSFFNFSEASVAHISLAKRAPVIGPSVLVGFDIDDRAWQYDLLSTQWSQGGCGTHKKTTEFRKADDVYNFKYWQYLDISYYFGHGIVTVPPAMWTNAAHKNGVRSLGTFNLNSVNPSQLLDPQHLHQTIDILFDISKSLKFDGYLINYENTDTQQKAPLLVLMRSLRDKGLMIIWYDAPISGGFANYFNEEAISFFNSAGYFHSNYWWDYPKGYPAKSYQTLVNHQIENLKNHVFQMGDAYRDPYKNNPFQKCVASQTNQHFLRFKDVYTDASHTSYYTALGFFAPNWTMFGVEADPVMDTHVPDVGKFEQSDAAYWEGSGQYGCGHADFRNVSYFVQPRTAMTTLPFYTNFNTGVGERYFINAQSVSSMPWSHFTLQAILPTWQNVILNSSRLSAKAYFNYQEAYEGGSCWKIEDNTISQANVTFKLFKTAITTTDNDEIDLIVKPNSNETVQLVLNQTQSLTAVNKTMLTNNWQLLVFKLPNHFTVTEIDVAVKPNSVGTINVNLGSLKIFHPGTLPKPENQMATAKDSIVSWTAKHPDSLYRIYGQKSNGDYVLLNMVANTYYDLHGNIFNDGMNFNNYLIQEVTAAGDSIPVSLAKS